MLVLTRKPGESLVLGNNIRVTVVDCGAGGVRLGIEAPRDVSILRAELHDEVERANRGSRETQLPPPTLVERLRRSRGAASGPQPAPPAGKPRGRDR